jgi:CHAT domain-containing protein/tetratricopeptide (TPR) repeat protein
MTFGEGYPYCKSVDMRCPKCGEEVHGDIWFVVDSDARPDLFEKCLDDSIHKFVCSGGHLIRVGAPLLVLDRRQSRLLFSKIGDNSPGTDEKSATTLLTQLREAGCAEVEELSAGIEILPRWQMRMALHGKSVQDITRLTTLLQRLDESDLSQSDLTRQLCEEALDILGRKDAPVMWASLKTHYAVAILSSRIAQPAVAEVELAVQAARDACGVLDQRESPDEWARAQTVLASALAARSAETPGENSEQVIRALQDALSAVNKDAPDQFAALQMRLGEAFTERKVGDPEENIESAELAYAAALMALDPVKRPDVYAAVLRKLAQVGRLQSRQAPSSRGAATRARIREQLRKSVDIYRNLEEPVPGAYAGFLGEMMRDLAREYWMQDDLVQARDVLEGAVAAHRRASLPEGAEWNPQLAKSLEDLAEVLDIQGNREKSAACLIETVAIYRQLAAREPERYQVDLAFALSDLGRRRTPHGQGDTSAGVDLQQAHECFAQAADIFRALVDEQPEDLLYQYEFATALNAAATSELKLLGENPNRESLERYRDRIEEAVAIFRHLAGQDYKLHTGELALTLTNLGSVCQQLGDIAAACRAYTDATSTREHANKRNSVSALEPVGSACMALANLQLGRSEYASARNTLEQAVACFRSLRQLRPGKYDGELVAAWELLGQVRDTLGDEEGAFECIESALVVREHRESVGTPTDSALRRALSLVNRGNMRRKMKDLDGALSDCLEGLELLRKHGDATSKQDARLMALCLVNTGGTIMEKGAYRRAIDSLQEAARIFRTLARGAPEHLPELALTLANLGIAYMVCGDAESARNNLQESLVLRRIQADLYPAVFSTAVASTLMNLALLEENTGNSSSAIEKYEEAIEIFSQAEQWSPAARAHELFACWNNLGTVYLPDSSSDSLPDYRKARHALRNAVKSAELSRDRFADIAQRRRVLGEALSSYKRLIACCIELWKQGEGDELLHEAVEAVEASRARMLTEVLVDEEPRAGNAPVELVAEFQHVRRHLRELDRLLFEEERGSGVDLAVAKTTFTHVASTPIPPGFVLSMRGLGEVGSQADSHKRRERIEVLKRDAQGLRDRYKELLEKVRAFDPEHDWDSLFPPIGYDKMRSLLPNDESTAIVQFVVADHTGYALIVGRSWVTAVELPELTQGRLGELGREWVALRRRTRVRADRGIDEIIDKGSRWQREAVPILSTLSKIALHPILHCLARASRIVLAPVGALHLFPLHACTSSQGRFLLDDFEVLYTPSLSILYRCWVQKRETAGGQLLITNPTGDLPFAEVEGHCVSAHYPGATRLTGGEAKRDRILEELRNCELLHWSGHGLFDERDPLSSALVLEDRTRRSKWLPLREVICGLRMECNSLSVLSGCETGLLVPDLMDEYVSLPLGFLSAGSKCVVSTLWEIDDLSTALLFDRFYAQLRDGLSPAAALQSAQQWLRDIPTGGFLQDEVVPELLTKIADEGLRELCGRLAAEYADRHRESPPFTSLLHWAPFVTVGLGYDLQTDA